MKNNLKQGFTLIELLVVIAIIGILASVVLASLNSARDKGADAAIKSNLNNARAQAELYYDNNSRSYDDVCTASGGISKMYDGAVSSATGGADSVACGDAVAEWAMKARLQSLSNDDAYYCVDSTGNAEEYASGWSDTAVTACP